VESNYGDISGKYPLLQALGTLSCEGRRQSYFRGEFFATMLILQRGDLTQHSVVVDKLLGRPMCGRVWHNYGQKNKEVFNLATLLITVKWPQLFERIKINAKGIQLSAMAEKNTSALLIFHMFHWY
jgi:hypothetical protein